mmetsp:Transcript_5622/g.15790  ORF Transcript_5622/g.15790 Transcript_5622/m.15790 type:complete len:129 (+) Transcript_5622:40-426(+)
MASPSGSDLGCCSAIKGISKNADKAATAVKRAAAKGATVIKGAAAEAGHAAAKGAVMAKCVAPFVVGCCLATVCFKRLWRTCCCLVGFEGRGVRSGSYAAGWQSTYPSVPKDSSFALLQRATMTRERA